MYIYTIMEKASSSRMDGFSVNGGLSRRNAEGWKEGVSEEESGR